MLHNFGLSIDYLKNQTVFAILIWNQGANIEIGKEYSKNKYNIKNGVRQEYSFYFRLFNTDEIVREARIENIGLKNNYK